MTIDHKFLQKSSAMIAAIIYCFVTLFCASTSVVFADTGLPGIPGIDIPPTTVSSLQPTAYLGRWYQMYTSLIPTLTYEKDGYCVVADYSNPSVEGTKVSWDLRNSLNQGSPTGELKQVTGTAVNEAANREPGKYRISMDDSSIPFDGFYWVVALGEIPSGQTQYPWAIVSVPFQTSLFILARDVDDFKQNYQTTALQIASEKGFTNFFNKPIATFQSTTECQYPPAPA